MALHAATALALSLSVSAGVAQAAPTWLSPITLSGFGAQGPDVSMNAQGDSAVAWVVSGTDGIQGRVQAAFRSAGGTFSAPQTISDPNHQGWVSAPDVAIDAQGNTIVSWVLADDFNGTNSRIQAAFRPAGGAFAAPQTIFAPGTDPGFLDPAHVAMDPQGNAVLVWHRFYIADVRIQAAFRPAGGSFGGTQTVSAPGGGARNPQVAVDPQGNAILVWERSDGANSRVQAAFRPAGGTFGDAQTVSDPGEDAFRGGVAVDPQGNALAIWKAVLPSLVERVKASFRPAGGSFGAPVDISGPSQSCDCPEPPPGVGFDAQGNAVAAWIQDPGGGNARAQAAFRPSGASFGGTQVLGPAGAGQEGILLAVDPQGGALAVWPRADASIQAAFRPAGGTFGPAQPVSATGVQAGVAMDSQGNGLAAWTRGAPNSLIEAAGFDGAGPRLDGLRFPAGGLAGSLLSFSVSPLDVWSAVSSTSWVFGDGGSAVGSNVSYAYNRAGSYTASVTSTDTVGNSSSAQGTVAVTGSGALLKALVSMSIPKSIRIGKAARRGVPVFVVNRVRDSTDNVTLLASARDLRAQVRRTSVGQTVKRHQRAGRVKIRVRLTRDAARKLRRTLRSNRRVTLTVRVVATAPGTSPATVRRSIRIRR